MDMIRFPGLGLKFVINPVAFNILGKDIYWYGIIIALGFLLAMLFAIHESKRVGVNPEIMMDIVLWGTPSAILGARLYYVIFKWSYYKRNPGEIIAIWEGGLAIYGAIIAALLTTVIYCRIKKISIREVLDIGCFGLLIGQAVGRWGNFVNQEAYGAETKLPWRMEVFDNDLSKFIEVHPTFLYESLWNTVGFLILLWFRKRKRFDGELFLYYTIWYGFGRFWIEGLRADSLYLGNIRISQLVAATAVIAGIILLYIFSKKRNTDFEQ